MNTCINLRHKHQKYQKYRQNALKTKYYFAANGHNLNNIVNTIKNYGNMYYTNLITNYITKHSVLGRNTKLLQCHTNYEYQ